MKKTETCINFIRDFFKQVHLFLLMVTTFVLIQSIGFAQTVVTVGAGTSNGTTYPLYAFNGYNYSQQLYLGSESSLAGSYSNQYITAIRFYWGGAGNLTNTGNWVVYLGNTTQSTFSTATSWIPLASMTQVYNGGVTLPAAAGWMTIVLDAPFQYTGNNIVVAIDENVSGYGSSSTNWQYSNPGAYRAIKYGNDATNPDPASPPAGTTSNTVRANIQFDFFNSASPTNVVAVSATSGTASRSYPNLKYAFDAVNSGIHKGDVTIGVGSTDNESITVASPLVVYASGSGSASYSNVTINPSHSNITITGSFAGACCVPTSTFQLNATQNVTIDGRIGSTGSTNDLTIENTSTGTWATSMLFYGASGNTVKYCNIKSATLSTQSGVGTVSFLLNGTSGCSNNIIEYCNITKSGANMPLNAIASSNGSSTYKSQNNTVRYCTISDFQKAGIWLGNSSVTDYNESWTIDHNTFYESSPIIINSTNFYNYSIMVGYHTSAGANFYTTSGSHIITNNTIGGNGAGGDWTVTSTTGNSGLVVGGVFFAATTTAYSEISGNEIKNFNITSWVNSNTTISGFNGIYVYHTKVKIGSTAGNSIHDITLAHPSTWGGIITGITLRNNTNYSCEISNNQVYNITAETKGAGATDCFQYFYGIYDWAESAVFDDVVNKNSVKDINVLLNNSCFGIHASGAITQNHVSNIKVGGTAGSDLTGIYFFGVTTANRPNLRVDNNEVILGLDKNGVSTAVDRAVYGINLNGIGCAYYNSVLIQGVHTGANNTCCLKLNTISGTGFSAVNNLLYNNRSGGSGKHYCILTTGTNAITSSNNSYVIYASAKATYYIGNWAGTDKSTLNDWQTAASESASIAETNTNKPVATVFPELTTDNTLKPGDLWLKSGTAVAAVIDKENEARPAAPTTMGAYELSQTLPVELINIAVRKSGNINVVEWQTASETNNDYFEVEKSTDANDWVKVGKVKGAGNSNSVASYNYNDGSSTNNEIMYYRLKQVDYDGKFSYSWIVSLNALKERVDIQQLYPVPANDVVFVTYSTDNNQLPVVKLHNTLGYKVAELTADRVADDKIEIRLDQIPQGQYCLELDFGYEVKVMKLIIVR